MTEREEFEKKFRELCDQYKDKIVYTIGCPCFATREIDSVQVEYNMTLFFDVKDGKY